MLYVPRENRILQFELHNPIQISREYILCAMLTEIQYIPLLKQAVHVLHCFGCEHRRFPMFPEESSHFPR
jgi:hypothetical protein